MTTHWPKRKWIVALAGASSVAVLGSCASMKGQETGQQIVLYGSNEVPTITTSAYGTGTINTWGLSYRQSKSDCTVNKYRPRWLPASEIGMLDCISVVTGSGAYGVFGGEFEPHDEMPLSCTTPFPQGDGNWGANELLPIRRNVIFGDGHGLYVKRRTRTFAPNDSF